MISKKVRARLLALALGGGGLLVASEIALRFLPVSTGMRPLPVNAEAPVFRFEPSHDFVFSRDWNFAVANRGWINNDGFVNDQDYERQSEVPLLAVVGDSYIEAAMVPYARTVQGRLAGELAGRGRVYSFAASGAPLSQYLVWARYARDTYRPDSMVISVVGNDFDESLVDYGFYPGQHHFVRGEDGGLELLRLDFTPNALGPVLYSSALGRYLYLNLKVRTHVGNLLRWVRGVRKPQVEWFVGNTQAEYTPQRLEGTYAALDAFFRLLPEMSGLPPERVLFVLDGMRPELYDPPQLERADTSFFGVVRAHFSEQARALGYEVVDLQPLFMERFERDGEHFEFPTDRHWNGAGHAVVADAVRASRVYRAFAARLAE